MTTYNSVPKSVCRPRKALETLKPYSGDMPEGKLILAANESPFNLPSSVCEQIKAGIDSFDFNRYPDPLSNKLRAKIAEANGVSVDSVLIGNGGDELLLDIMLAWGGLSLLPKGAKDNEAVPVNENFLFYRDFDDAAVRQRRILTFSPTFSMYQIYAQALDANVLNLPRDPEKFELDVDLAVSVLSKGGIDLCLLDNPSNPIGSLLPQKDICRILEASDTLVVIDEAYFEFAGVSMLEYLDKYRNMVILRTFSKAYSLAGLRLGYVMAHKQVITELAKVRMPYSVNSFTQWTGELVMDAANAGEFDQTIADIMQERDKLYAAMSALPKVEVWESKANYILFRLDKAKEVWQRLYDVHGIYIRDFTSSYGLGNCLRVTVGDGQQNIQFLTALRESIAMVNLPDNFAAG